MEGEDYQRPLNIKEAEYLILQFTNNIVVCGSVHLEQTTHTLETITAAFSGATQQIQAENPLWNTSVVNRGTAAAPKYFFVKKHVKEGRPPAPIPVIVHQTDDIASREQLCSICADEVQESALHLPRVRLLVPSHPEGSTTAAPLINQVVVIMTVPHFIADGRSSLEQFKRLLVCALAPQIPLPDGPLQRLTEGHVPIVPKNTLPFWYIIGTYLYFVAFLLWSEYIGRPIEMMRSPQPDMHIEFGTGKMLTEDMISTRSLFDILLLNAAETHLLLVTSKKLGVTVTTLLSFAIAKSIAITTKAPAGSNIAGGGAIDIRPQLGLSRSVNGCFVTGFLLVHCIHESDQVTLAEIRRVSNFNSVGSSRFIATLFLKKTSKKTVITAKKAPFELHLAYGVSSLGKYDAIELGDTISVQGIFFGSSSTPLQGTQLKLHAVTFDNCLSISVSASQAIISQSDFDACMTALRRCISNMCQ
ncbi:hypothetical protein BASA50_008129 [Batrachochytrium salamandrivorans]|uniref:O-acyltransferase WSD1 C-terminal domain-containing protein n=1 Tax=Batrachochytrium salamandrivorans TaxID=1357716 RepID=A0ABQ8F518_9FUNG|nr:hypothetical protein BASA62_008663 [Batrachochytrium salamandrivorans]KAH6592345.1 hypothetical protein BASA50_008129 [Batrachochytrium salamandrivorans]KAH6602878.1 hypothetical protein BASA61_000655 [Batrachochytrium salamandrivorans]KAJ1327212.1 hypothetical protein BSLG_010554 [Batrachochytrium salamandrivorans]